MTDRYDPHAIVQSWWTDTDLPLPRVNEEDRGTPVGATRLPAHRKDRCSWFRIGNKGRCKARATHEMHQRHFCTLHIVSYALANRDTSVINQAT